MCGRSHRPQKPVGRERGINVLCNAFLCILFISSINDCYNISKLGPAKKNEFLLKKSIRKPSKTPPYAVPEITKKQYWSGRWPLHFLFLLSSLFFLVFFLFFFFWRGCCRVLWQCGISLRCQPLLVCANTCVAGIRSGGFTTMRRQRLRL